MKVLSPAGSIESFYSALYNGADEIYMGVNAFNARAKADNIDIKTIKKAITDAHILGAKVFCTLNTLVFENEIEEVVKVIYRAINLGFDAFIVQDLSVVKLLKEIKSDVVIHLSTQLGLHNSFGALQAKALGAERIVLSREATLDDIKAIKKAVPEMEIEYFVQGALCVAFSGNCYLSNRLLDKSGNRGQCAQLCRLNYTASENGKQICSGYLMSPADLCLYKHLRELKDAGVYSIKIEGRLRRASYVGQATAFYRKAVDNMQSQNYGITKNDVDNLKTTFNRGNYLYDAYLYGENGNIIYKQTQNHIGIEIGTVKACEKFKDIYRIYLNVSRQLQKQDGLKIFRNGIEVASLGVGNVEKSKDLLVIYSKQKLQSGDVVNLIHSELQSSEIGQKRRYVDLELDTIFKVGEKAKVVLKIKNTSISVCVQSDFVLETSISSPVTETDIENCFSKLNDTSFRVTKINNTLDNVFIPKSKLNELRREAVQKLRFIFEPKVLQEKTIDFDKLKTTKENIGFIELKLKRSLDDDESCVAFFPNDYISTETLTFVENYLQKNDILYLFLPPVASDKDIRLIYEKYLPFKDNVVMIANNIGQLYFSKEYRVIAGDFCNITNSLSYSAYKQLGTVGCCLGFEFKDRTYNAVPFDYKIVDNNIVCFLSHCPYKAVYGTDCKNCSFNNSLTYTSEGKAKYKVNRYRISKCYFFLSN